MYTKVRPSNLRASLDVIRAGFRDHGLLAVLEELQPHLRLAFDVGVLAIRECFVECTFTRAGNNAPHAFADAVVHFATFVNQWHYCVKFWACSVGHTLRGSR